MTLNVCGCHNAGKTRAYGAWQSPGPSRPGQAGGSYGRGVELRGSGLAARARLGSRPHREHANLGVLVTGNSVRAAQKPCDQQAPHCLRLLAGIMACSTHCLWDQRPQNASPTLKLRISRGLQETAGPTDHDGGAGLGESHLSTPALRPTCPVQGQSQGCVPPTGAGFPLPREESSEVCDMSLSPMGHPHT